MTKSAGPMEQVTIFLLRFHVGSIQMTKNHRPHETINHISIWVSFRVDMGWYKWQNPQLHGTINQISIRVSFRVDTNDKIHPPHGQQLTVFLPGFHLGLIQMTKSTNPMKQLTIFLFYLRLIQVNKIQRPHWTINSLSIRVSFRVDMGWYKWQNPPDPWNK